MTRKHKPQTAHRKRPAAQPSKPVRPAAAAKAVAAVASLRDKDRGRGAPVAGQKGAAAGPPGRGHAKVNDSARPAELRAAGSARAGADKRPLGIERRVPVMPED